MMRTLVMLMFLTSSASAELIQGDYGACCYGQSADCLDLPNDDNAQTFCEEIFGGTWMGAGTACSEDACNWGACCIEEMQNECTDNVTEQDCDTLGGQFYGFLSTCAVEGGACSSAAGACCLNWLAKECYENYSEEWCYTKGGKFIGEGTTCNDALWCTTYYGSCCFGEWCEDAWGEQDCENNGGIFWFDSCADLQDVEMCVATVGACCIKWEFYCEDNVIQDDCLSMGGDFLGYQSTCENEGDYCQAEIGACCVDKYECYDSTLEQDCFEMDGYFYGDGTICNDATDCVYFCSSDINEDGQTNVHDLLAVIDQWGLFETPADVNQDSIVNVSDLLIVVGNWGLCE